MLIRVDGVARSNGKTIGQFCAIIPPKATGSCRRKATLYGIGVCLGARGCSLWCNLPHRSEIARSAVDCRAIKGAVLVEDHAALRRAPVALAAKFVENRLIPHPAGWCQFKYDSRATAGRPVPAPGR